MLFLRLWQIFLFFLKLSVKEKTCRLLLQWNNGLGIMITVELHWLTSVKPKSSEVKQMPNIESAIKRVRSANANAKNSSQTNAMRTAIKKFEEAVAAGADNVDALYNEAVKAVDMLQLKV